MHELLAVETSIAGNYGRDMAETIHLFQKPEAFRKEMSQKTHFEAENAHLNVTTETANVTTVPARLDWFSGMAKKYFDIQVSKDLTNQKAVADVVLSDGTVIYKNVPSTTLLMLESKLGVELRKVFEAIPTLDANIIWKFDENEGMWRATGQAPQFVTKKVFTPLTLAPATDKHPAQVKEGWEDRPVAQVTKSVLSGMITSHQKAVLLGRLDELVAAVKKARQRANATEVAEAKGFGEAIIGFITKDLKLGG